MDTALANAEKLLDLLKGFQHPEDFDTCTAAEVIATGEHNISEYERLENKEPEKLLHINGLLARLMSKIQPLVAEKYNVVNPQTARDFLVQFFREVEEETGVWQNFIKRMIDELDLNEEQAKVTSEFMKVFPYLAIEELFRLIGNSFLIPEENSPEIVNTLAEMAKEG